MSGKSRTEQFWAKVDKRAPDECWPWLATRTIKNYGQIADGRGGSMQAHRFSWELHHGPIPEGLTVDHTCHTPRCPGGNTCEHRACVNPAHLEVVENLENIARGISFSARNARKTHCKWGHELGADNSYGYKNRRQCKTCARLAAAGKHPRQQVA